MTTRREFLGEASCSAIGTVAAISSLLNLRLVGELAADFAPANDDYRALVCVFLAGGNDAFNMLAPVEGEAHQNYLTSRGSVALPVSSFATLSNSSSSGSVLGVQSGMSGLKNLYDQGKCAFLTNVGTLVEPTSLLSYQNRTAKLPLGLFSHSDQQMQWQSSIPDSRTVATGWGGRMSDMLSSLNSNDAVSMNVSVSNINLFQTGAGVAPFVIGADGVPGLNDWDATHFATRRQAASSLLEAEYGNVFQRSFSSAKKGAISAAGSYKEALDAVDSPATEFTPGNSLSKQLKVVAQTIAARDLLGKKRQTFFVTLGGWDNHGSLEGHPAMLAAVSDAITEFTAEMESLEVSDSVTLFTASDFGRTLSTNVKGTDHAWGGNQIIVGGAVNGGRVLGEYPDLSLGSPLDVGRGRFIPTTSVDEYFADLALWMGVPSNSLGTIFPNLDRFYSATSVDPPLGIFKCEDPA